jgi:ABC-type phosphate transport system auxiliary subunit
MAFNWKSLFIEQTEQEKAAELAAEKAATITDMPPASTAKITMPTSSAMKPSTTGDAFNEVLAVYEKGFEGLNQDGYDFFEMYKAVMAVGADNPQAYQMAFAMGKSIKSDLSKNILIEKSQYYVQEIAKVHSKYDDIGNKKKNDLAAQLNAEKTELTNQINSLEGQLTAINAQLSKTKTALSGIDGKFNAPLADMDQRIEANNQAKDTILNSINKVINGINQNL